jgi:hypothetical protein
VYAKRRGSGYTDILCLGMASVYSFFGITLAISMKDFWGPNSPGLQYWSVADEPAQWFARGLGVWMTVMTLSPYLFDMPKSALVKPYLVSNVIFMGMFIEASFFLETTKNPPSNILPVNMWWTQLPIAAFFLFANVMALGEGKTKGKKK